ncbi:MAG: PIN domain-containing protein [bacterium]
MTALAYVDSSCILAIALGEPSAKKVAERLNGFVHILAHPLLDAEVRSTCSRERATLPQLSLDVIQWIEAPRPLSEEVDRVLAAGYLRGADCLHVAAALYLSPDPAQLTFLTLDARQGLIAKKLGFKA